MQPMKKKVKTIVPNKKHKITTLNMLRKNRVEATAKQEEDMKMEQASSMDHKEAAEKEQEPTMNQEGDESNMEQAASVDHKEVAEKEQEPTMNQEGDEYNMEQAASVDHKEVAEKEQEPTMNQEGDEPNMEQAALNDQKVGNNQEPTSNHEQEPSQMVESVIDQEELEAKQQTSPKEVVEPDMSKLMPVQSTAKTRGVKGGSALSIVCSHNSNKRMAIAKDISDKLGLTTQAEFSFLDSYLAICKPSSPNFKNTFKLNDQNNKKIVYSAALVKEVIDSFDLNFEGITSMSFYDVTYKTYKGKEYALIEIN